METNIEELISKFDKKGYFLHSKIKRKNTILNFIKPNGIGVIIYLEKDKFEIYYNIDLVIKLTTGKFKLSNNDKFFNKMERKVEEYIDKLNYVNRLNYI